MKSNRIFLAVFLAAATVARADVASELAALRSLESEAMPRPADGTHPPFSQAVRWMEARAQRVTDAAMKFYNQYPTAPERWEAALITLKASRNFIIELKPGVDEAAAAMDGGKLQSLIVRDEVASKAWEQSMESLEASLLSASDVPENVVGEAYTHAIYRLSLRRGLSPAEKWAAAQPLVTAMESRVRNGTQLARAFELVERLIKPVDPEGYLAMLRRLSQSELPEVSAWAVGKANIQAAKTTAVEMKFTALDGREVDLSKLRGKVVLIDFWATWCGPCKEEIPNVRAVYEKYHSSGFDVVGISLDSAKDKQVLIDYCRTHDLPWPQHFDGNGWKNEYAVKYSIRGIPAMFLLDQQGKVVATDARGPKLEKEVKRLLNP